MGVVYRARDTSLNRFVALKFLAGHLLNSESARTRFYHEARIISALSHPNIAVIYEIGEEADEPFLALEYLSGGTLHSRLAAVLLGLCSPRGRFGVPAEIGPVLAYRPLCAV